MKKVMPYLLIALFVPQTDLHAQSPIVQQIINSVNIDSLIYFVRELSGNVPTTINGTSQTILSRHKDQPGNALAEAYIRQKLEAYGLITTTQSFGSTGKNVFARQLGTQYPNKQFIINAHYDALPSGSIAPGADDNASGTAAVIEAARIFTKHSFPFTIVYALWDEEEIGIFGSNYYATQAAAVGDSIIGVITLDGLGYDFNNGGVVNIQNRANVSLVQLYDNMVEVNKQYGIHLGIVQTPPYAFSDHANFWYNGYDAILLSIDVNSYDWQYNQTVNDLVHFLSQPDYLKTAKLA
jgi:Zn-dependent M28 family amino/carboxypeptidase